MSQAKDLTEDADATIAPELLILEQDISKLQICTLLLLSRRQIWIYNFDLNLQLWVTFLAIA